jgi:dihydroorotase
VARTLIRNARLIDGRGEHGKADLYLKDGLIEGVNLGGDVAAGYEAGYDADYDAKGNVVTPAFVELHAHLREPGQEVKEDLRSGLGAAAAGGYGTVVSMANTTPVVDEPQTVADLIAKAERIAQARLRPAAALSHGLEGKRLTDFAALKEAGAVMITDDGVPVADGHLMRRACDYAAQLGLVVQTHSEDPSLRGDGVMNEGAVSQRLGLPGNPVGAEAAMIYRDCEIARMTGASVHIAHVSSKRGLQVVEWFKAQGAPVSAEVTPHHLTLTDRCLTRFDPIYKVAPPLRTEDDVAYLRAALKRGAVDAIGTDHAPHTRAEKDRDLIAAPFGIANIEVAFPLLYSELVGTGQLSLGELLHFFQTGPAKVMGWPLPTLEPGQAADLTVLDLDTVRPVDPKSFKSKAKFSPWEARELKGWPVATFVRGARVFTRGAP